LDHLCTAQFRLLRLGYHCTFASSSFPALCDAYATYATVARLAPYHAPQAPEARTFPRLTRHSHAILTASVNYCHHQFAPSCRPKELFSLEYQVRALSLRKAQCSRASRAYVALFTHLDTSLSHQAVITIISLSFCYVCMHQSHFAQSAVLPRFHTPMAPYACAFPRLARHSYTSHASSQLLQPRSHYACSSLHIPHHNFACSPHDALSGDTQNLSPQEM